MTITTSNKPYSCFIGCFGDVDGASTTDYCYSESLTVKTDLPAEKLMDAVESISKAINARLEKHITFEAHVDEISYSDEHFGESSVSWSCGEPDDSQPFIYFQKDVRLLKSMVEVLLRLKN